jgi:hypothetical protein
MKVQKITLEIIINLELEKGIRTTEDGRLLGRVEVLGKMNLGLGSPTQAKVSAEADLTRMIKSLMRTLFTSPLITVRHEEMTLEQALRSNPDPERFLDDQGSAGSVPAEGG